ncbi:MAG: EF-hand domain-containing protein [Burkholderiaceae bacterium]|nr:EF-hand domain-containing protein [Burkholderiaceae bacterium]
MSRIHPCTRRWLAPAAIALAALLMPSVAAAQKAAPQDKAPPQDKSPHALFARIDTNSDGKVSKREITRMPGIATRWQELDKDKDGSLSREEFVAGFRT